MDVGSLDENLQLGEDCKNLDVSPIAAKSNFEVMTDTNENGAEVHSPQITENHGFYHVDLNEQDHKDSPILPDLHEEGLNYHSLTSKDKNLEEPCSPKYTGLCYDDTVAASPHVSDAVRSPLGHEIFRWQEEGEQHCSFDKHSSLAQDQEFRSEADIEHSSHCLPGVSSCGGQDDIQNTGLHSADISRTSNAEADKYFHVQENDYNPKHPIARKDDIYHSEALYFENQDKTEGENDIELCERDQKAPSSLRKESSVSPSIPHHVQGSQEETAGIVDSASPRCHLNTPENPSVGLKGSSSPDLSLPGRGHISSSNCESQVDSHQHADSLHINSVHKSHSPQRESHRRGDSSPGASYRENGCPASGSHHQAEFPPRESHRQAISPQKRLPSSPRRRDSSRRKGRSRSPNRHRDSSEHKRARHGRSRSRSPHAMDRYGRSPRRRHSPRHRSPPSRSRTCRHSPVNRGRPAQSNRSSGVGRPGKNLFIAGFSFGTTERDLDRKFSRFGRVTDVRIVRDKRSGDSRGFGFLSLERDEDADAAIRAFDQTEWNGRILLVEKSKTFVR